MHLPTDQELIDNAARGDRSSFRMLVERHQRFVFSVACRMLWDKADAEDVAQEVFVLLWKNLSKYDHKTKFTTWLYRIITNRCIDSLRSGDKKRLTRSRSLDAAQLSIRGESTEDVVTGTELNEVVRLISEGLSPMQKAVFVLRDIEGLAVEEVCSVLSLSPVQLKSNLYHARVALGEKLKLYYAEKQKLL